MTVPLRAMTDEEEIASLRQKLAEQETEILCLRLKVSALEHGPKVSDLLEAAESQLAAALEAIRAALATPMSDGSGMFRKELQRVNLLNLAAAGEAWKRRVQAEALLDAERECNDREKTYDDADLKERALGAQYCGLAIRVLIRAIESGAAEPKGEK